jgi:lysophospholipase L1-like esterase
MNKKTVAVLGLLAMMAFTLPQKKKLTVWLVGDSTMSVKEVKAFPETGWGMPFAHFFDSAVTVNNRAQNGRSTKTFITEKRWQQVLDNLKKGDYVFIQFGHNDEVPVNKSYTTEAEFKASLVRYVTETRSLQGLPVLLTPVACRKFDASGNITVTHEMYSAIVRSVAAEYKVPLIDLDKKSQVLLQQPGPETSKGLYNWLAPGEHLNYPEGKQDDIHFSELGARKIAELVLQEIRALQLELADRIVKTSNSK